MRNLGINTDFIELTGDHAGGYAQVKLSGFSRVFVIYTDRERTLAHIQGAKQAGLIFDTLHGPWENINAIWREGLLGEQVIDRIADCVDFAGENGIPTVIIHLASGENSPPVSELGGQRLDALVDRARKAGVKLAFENQRKLAYLQYALARYKKEPCVGFCWDAGHEHCFTMDEIDFMALFGSRVYALHLHDNLGEYNRDLHRIPFEGNIDFAQVAEKIKASGYQGTVMLEIIRRGYPALSNVQFLEKAAAAAQRLRRMLGGEE